ncbi:DEAD/DEAH family helicase [Williamsoniiplasma luminosum]|uniref:DEAD/DEAH family helicase n=2 Tax=Williamsoniiplasma luminosum TaxID=214888 RepID=A0A2K8NXD1_9MOLU|nr:DEAD/DEAH box helicase family protein [Williamsoniiplasma luminosum]ATZ17293.1 DEAD/DEAH family helicase [Williamsoniiplasma luminosum]
MNTVKQNEFIFKKLEAYIKKENNNVEEIKIISPFISKKGIKFMQEIIDEAKALKTFKIITTTFDGTSKFLDLHALKTFKKQNKKVEIIIENSYLLNMERLHSKNIIFVKSENNNSSAFVGSSNMTDKGLKTGKESSVRVDSNFNPRLFEKINNYFDMLWEDDLHFFNITNQDMLNIVESKMERFKNQFIKPDLKDTDFHSIVTKNEPMQLFEYQKVAINKIFENINNGNKKHLLVMATGTGKTFTIMSFVKQYYENPDVHKNHDLPKVLYLAPKNEILEQAIISLKNTFSEIQNDDIFKFFNSLNQSNNYKNEAFIFSSYQSALFNQEWLVNQHFDLVIIDEVHHSEASGLKDVISKIDKNTKHIIGLTATPERTDGVNIASYFDNQILFNMSLHEAIDSGHLSDFDYFFVDDTSTVLTGLDINKDLTKLAKQLNTKNRHELILKTINEKIIPYEDDDVKAILFCVNIEHAQNTSDFLETQNLKSKALTSNSNDKERKEILENFKKGNINFLCVVDIFNEGIDIPEINNILFLRPTSSFLIYIQQFGRGLRKQENKVLSVYDFVNNVDLKVNKKYHPFWLTKLLMGDNIKNTTQIISSIKDNEFNTREKWMPGNSIVHFNPMNKKIIIDKLKEYAKFNAFDSLFDSYFEKINTYDEYEEFFFNSQLETYEFYQKLNQENLISNQENLEIGSKDKDILMNFSTLNHQKIIEEFLKIIKTENKVDPFLEELFISYFYTNRTTVNKYKPNLTRALETIFSKTELLRELEYLLTFKLNNEVLIPNELNDFNKMILSQFQMQVIMNDYSKNGTIEAKTIMKGVQEISNKIFINAGENTQNSKFGHKNYFDENENILHWDSPDGWSLDNQKSKDLLAILNNNLPVYIIYKSNKIIEKFNTKKYGTFIGLVDHILQKNEIKTENGIKKIQFQFKIKPL